MRSPSRSSRSKSNRQPLARYRRAFLEQLEERSLLAAIFTVNSTLDTNFRDNELTLREAIMVNNRSLAMFALTAAEQSQIVGTPTSTDADTIAFNIPGSGVQTIGLQTTLPAISDTLTIDGYTQPGAVENSDPNGFNGVLQIEITRASPSVAVSSLLNINADNCVVRGLALNGASAAIVVLSSNNLIQGNLIGTDAQGRSVASASAVQVYGIDVNAPGLKQVAGNIIGGADLRDRNLISGNLGAGIRLIGGQSNIVGTVIQGNLIGTDVTGTLALANGYGVTIYSKVFNTTIGGLGLGNLISGNTQSGIQLGGQLLSCGSSSILASGSDSTIIQGNIIGADISGTNPLPNAFSGISLSFGTASSNTIGGTDPAMGNVIAFNGLNGISVLSSGVQVLSNSIFSNAQLGIHLGPGCTPVVNDPVDGDTGPNRLQNYPAISSATGSGGALTLNYSVPSATTNSSYPLRVEFYVADADGQEGKTLLGFDTYTADVARNPKSVTLTTSAVLVAGDRIVGTATDMAGNTSEFSPALVVQGSPPVITSNGGNINAAILVPENTTAVTDVNATSSDSGTTLTFSIYGGADANKFSMNPTTGVVTFVTAPNFESPTDTGGNHVYDIVVRASDGLLSDLQTIAVTVTNVNEAPVITSSGGGATATIGVPENQTAVTDVNAVDPDSGTTLTYSKVGGADSAKFAIDSTTGLLTFLEAPNFEAPTDADQNNIYEVFVRVSDGNLADTQTIAVTVGNVNEAPIITSDGGGATASLSVAENTLTVTTVRGTDIDTASSRLGYSISGGADAARFAINFINGALAFITAPDFENPADIDGDNVYDVVVSLSDTSLSTTQSIAVTVTNVADACNPVVVNTNDTGPGSLREAINCANTTANVDLDGDGAVDPDVISFNIPGSGVQTILVKTPLPVVTESAVIDGYTQLGASPNTNQTNEGDNAVLLIQISNSGGSKGFQINANQSTIRGLAIGGFSTAIDILPSTSNNAIEGNFIGLDANGAAELPNAIGITIQFGATNNTIGGSTPAARNVISANNGFGIDLRGDANTIAGNIVGLAADGTTALGHGNGIVIFGNDNLIGGTTAGSRNVISGNASAGITLRSSQANGAPASGNKIQGNFIGTDVSGTVGLSNLNSFSYGIAFTNSVANTLIGGMEAGAGNLISGNATGISPLAATSVVGTVIQGNYVGTDVTGTSAVGNAHEGIIIPGDATIGGTSRGIGLLGTDAFPGNLIAGQTFGDGLKITGPGAVVQGNIIGSSRTGEPLGNGHGIRIAGSSNQVGGAGAGEGNMIAYNTHNGVWVVSGESNSILGNTISKNGELGIDLGVSGTGLSDGVTRNDAGDLDTGPNKLQNWPEILSATTGGHIVTIKYHVFSATANSAYPLRIEFFKADSDGQEGWIFLGFDMYLPEDAESNKAIQFAPFGTITSGDKILATATDGNGNTSEFGASTAVIFGNQPPIGANNTISLPEDTRYTFKPSDFGFSDLLDLPANNFKAVKFTTIPISGALSVNGLDRILEGEVVPVASIAAGLLTYGAGLDSEGDALSRFTFQVQDDGGTANGGTDLDPLPKLFVFDSIPVNDAPRPQNDEAQVSEDDILEKSPASGVLENDFDPDIGDTLTMVAVNGVAANVGASLTLASGAKLVLRADGSYRYEPNGKFESLGAGQTATETFTYSIADGAGETSVGTVTITIVGQNDAPVARDDAFDARGEETRTILKSEYLANDTDVDSSNLTGVVVDQPGHGSASLRLDGSFAYTPAAGFSGLDKFTYRVSDVQAASNLATISLNVAAVNHQPVVVLSGDVSPSEGQSFVVNGSFSDPDNGESWTARVNYGDGSGDLPLTLSANKAFQLSRAYPDNGTYPVTVSVRDSSGLTGSASFLAIVQNAVPQIVTWSGPQLATRGQLLTYRGSFGDPGTADSETATVDWGDLSGGPATVAKTGGAWQVNATHKYASGGIFQAALTIQDDDGGTATAATTVMVVGARVNGDTFELVGSAQRDNIKLSIKGNAILVNGSLGSTKIAQAFPLAGVQTIVAYLGEGNDTLTVDAKVMFPLLVNAGGGNDVIAAGGGAAVLIGGLGQDQLTGGGKSDLLIAGTTAYDNRPAALATILAEWSSGRPLATRAENLRTGAGPVLGGLNIALKAKETVFDDTAIDKLLGGGDLDWFWCDLKKDKITGRTAAEAVN